MVPWMRIGWKQWINPGVTYNRPNSSSHLHTTGLVYPMTGRHGDLKRHENTMEINKACAHAGWEVLSAAWNNILLSTCTDWNGISSQRQVLERLGFHGICSALFNTEEFGWFSTYEEKTHITTRETTNHYIKRDRRQQHRQGRAVTHDNTAWSIAGILMT